MRVFARAAALALALLASSARDASAQTTSYGALVSSVRDSRGAPVAGARVVLAGPITRSAVTNSAGIVTLIGLPYGPYSVSITRAGFASIGRFVTVGNAGAGSANVLAVNLQTETFGSVQSPGGAASSQMPSRASNAPDLAATFAQTLATNVLALHGSAEAGIAAAPALEGTRPDETRAELDGIPLGSVTASGAALRFREAFDTSRIDALEGPGLSTASLQNAIGGIVEYRTPEIGSAAASSFDLGYDSAFGSFEHAGYTNTFGKAGVMVDAANGNAGDASETVKARLDLSRVTSLSLATYATNATIAANGVTTTDDAPAFAFDARTTLGTTTLQGRYFASSSQTTQRGASPLADDIAETMRGFDVAYDVPFAENTATFGYDRRSDDYAQNGVDDDAFVDTLRASTDLQFARVGRLELGDDLASGPQLPHRNDPHAVLTIRPNTALAVTLAAGSAYETPPQQLVTIDPRAPLAPETSFGYRLGAELTHGTDRVHVAAYELRRYDAFASLADARSSGLAAGFTRQSLPGRLGFESAVDFVRSYAFGPAQPAARYDVGTAMIEGQQLIGTPYDKMRFALTYLGNTTEYRFGTTLLGDGNGLSDRAVALGDASARFTFAPIGAVRLGVSNLFGAAVEDPLLAPFYPPHELTVTLER